MLATFIFCFHCEFKNTQRRMFTLFKQKPRKRERKERERKKETVPRDREAQFH